MRRLALSLAVLAASALPASAQDFIESAGGSWWVVGLDLSCLAINRSPIEFNASPYNAIVLHQYKTDNLPRLQAFFWPGAFTEGRRVQLSITPDGRRTVNLEAQAITSYQAVTLEVAPEDLLEAMSNVQVTTVKAEKITQILMFETGPIEAVADLMGKCIGR